MKKYTSLITRNSPTAILYLVDSSGSMAENINFEGELMRKSDAVCKIVNSALYELICRCRTINGYNDYFDIALLSYNGTGVTDLLEQYTKTDGFCSITDITNIELATKTHNYIRVKESGEKFVSQRTIPQYINIEPCGTTPMCTALTKAHDLLKGWVIKNRGKGSFPPMLINITDGESSDALPEELGTIANKIKRLSVEDGNILIFNIHLSSSENNKSVMFPSSYDDLPAVRNIKMLYDMSSTLPKLFHQEILNVCPEKRAETVEKAKAITCNSNMDTLIKALEVGSLSKSMIK